MGNKPPNKTAYQDPANGTSKLRQIGCYIEVGAPINRTYRLTTLPDLTWDKGASYNAQPIIGRASPVVTYANSKQRTISITLHMHSPTKADLEYNMQSVHMLASTLHPRYQGTYAPPPICLFSCGTVASGNNATASPFRSFRFIVTSIRQTFNNETMWDEQYMVPRAWDLEISGEVVYAYQHLPGANDVLLGNW